MRQGTGHYDSDMSINGGFQAGNDKHSHVCFVVSLYYGTPVSLRPLSRKLEFPVVVFRLRHCRVAANLQVMRLTELANNPVFSPQSRLAQVMHARVDIHASLQGQTIRKDGTQSHLPGVARRR